MSQSEVEEARAYVKYVSQITLLLEEARIAGFNIDTMMKDALAKANLKLSS